MPAPKTGERQNHRTEWLISVSFVVIAVLVVPVAAFLLRGGIVPVPDAPQVDSSALRDFGRGYAVGRTVAVGLGDAGDEIGLRGADETSLPLETLEDFVPLADGSMWVMDRPRETVPSGRARLFSPSGAVLSSFLLPAGAAVYAPGADGGLWVDFAQGDMPSETLRKYDKAGALQAEYVLPERVRARSISLTPSGEVWIQVEEAEVDIESSTSVYRSWLVPVAVGPDLTMPEDPAAQAVEGNFIGSDGALYRLEIDPVAVDAVALSGDSTVTATMPDGTTRRYKVASALRPYAADADGLLYCERWQPDPGAAYLHDSVGDAGSDVTLIEVYDEQGQVAVIPVERMPGVSAIHPAAYVSSDGSLWSATRAADAVVFVESVASDAVVSLVPADPSARPELALVAGHEPLSGDPYLARDPLQRDLMTLIYAGLVRHDDSLMPVGDIAEAVPVPGEGVSDDGLTIEYRVRTGLAWHDGQPVTGADVVATWEYLSARSTVSHGRPFEGFQYITGVSASGQVVTVTLSEPFGPGPESFFPYVLPAHLVAQMQASSNSGFCEAPVGCGPYAVTRISQDGVWQLKAHAASPRGDVTLDRIELRFSTGDDAIATFQSSDVPVVWLWPEGSQLADVRRDGVGLIEEHVTGRWWGLVMNGEGPVSSSRAVRHALLAAYPVEALLGQVVPADVQSATSGPFASVIATTTAAGGASSVASDRLSYVSAERGGFSEVSYEEMETVREAWEQSGFTVERKAGESRLYSQWTSAGLLARGEYDVATGVFPSVLDAGWGGMFDPRDVPDTDNSWGVGVVRIDDATLGSLYLQARRSYDRQTRLVLTTEIDQRLRELGAYAFLRPETKPSVVLGTIRNRRPAPYPAGDFWNVESWSLDERSDEQ